MKVDYFFFKLHSAKQFKVQTLYFYDTLFIYLIIHLLTD